MSEKQDFLVEIGVEELPPKSLLQLSLAFEKAIADQLTSARLNFADTKSFATPRRLAVLVSQLDESQPSQEKESLGPAVKAAFDENGEPTQAAQGFARKVGVEVKDLAQVDTEKGPRLAFKEVEQGAQTSTLLAPIIEHALDKLPIAKRMRWGSRREEFVRPVHWVLVLFGRQLVDATIMGLKTTSSTRGHRFHANKEIGVGEPALYSSILEKEGAVTADFEIRRDMIRQSVISAAETTGGSAVITDDLLNEVTALVEKPVALAGKFDESFLKVPSEALVSSMKEHQKYFHVVDKGDELLPAFITVANIESQDPSAVISGNERVIRPRLADAAFFYETDLKIPFENFRERLKPVVFQTKLGTVFDKTERVSVLASALAPLVSASAEDCLRAGKLCKNDLVTDMVGEFADLQGLMGRYYAKAAGENSDVAEAMHEQYLPRFAGDDLPKTAVGTAVALADRLDTLTGIFGIEQLPTGSKDPFALRRASLGVLRILVEGKLNASLRELLSSAHNQHQSLSADGIETLLTYMLDRFSSWFDDLGVPAESFIAVRALDIDDPLDIYHRTMAVTEFSKTAEAPALAAANKRVSNILSKSEATTAEVNKTLLSEEAEKTLFDALSHAQSDLVPLMKAKDYSAALARLASLREPIDAFFDQVMVMSDDLSLRNNRLALLVMLRSLFISIADISLLP